MADNDYTEKEVLLMIWQHLEDLREYNSNRKIDAEMWHKNTENTDKRTSKNNLTDMGKELRKNKVCLRYIENKLKAI